MTGNSAIVLDANVAVGLLKGKPSVVDGLSRFKTLYLPAIVLGELQYGAVNADHVVQSLERLKLLRKRCIVLDVDAVTAEYYGEIRLRLARLGRPIPGNDIWIAATCLARRLPLASNDAHFAVVPELIVEQF